MDDHRGAGDRWLSGELVSGVQFAPLAPIQIGRGARDGQVGVVLLLTGLAPEATYLVRLADGTELRVRQSALYPAG